MIRSPFDDRVAFEVLTAAELTDRDVLSSAESALLPPDCAASRRQEFRLGRIAAKKAMERLGGSEQNEVLRGSRGEPIWPEGFVGSISHTGDCAVAAVASKDSVQSLGVDIELRTRSVREGISRKIATPVESQWIESAPNEAHERIRMLFSVKEALYKALHSYVRRAISYTDVEVIFDVSGTCADVQIIEAGLRQALPAVPVVTVQKDAQTIVAGAIVS